MKNSKLINTFLNEPKPIEIIKAEGINFFTNDGKKYIDFTAGFTSHAILGWSQNNVVEAITNQLKKIPHIDYKAFTDRNREALADLLVSKTISQLDRVFFVGSSGGEACEAAMKLSYQDHYCRGNKEKNWFISREQSYHGSTTHSMAAGDRPNLDFYKPLFPKNMAKIPEHNVYRNKLHNETEDDYTNRCVQDLEKEILNIGPEKVCAFIAETICGGLVGDVPPTNNYWREIKKVCEKYDVHLILDEVWCGTGTSGKVHCFDWDNVEPDFVFIGKTLGAGYAPLSAVITTSRIEENIKINHGVIQYSNTHQGHSATIAGALEVQKIIHNDFFFKTVYDPGTHLREKITSSLKNNVFFKNVRGRGLRNSIEYSCKDQHLFGLTLAEQMKTEHNIIISGKWHRVSMSPALIVTWEELDFVIDRFIDQFEKLTKKWDTIEKSKIKLKNFF